jgi:hypothetical protein
MGLKTNTNITKRVAGRQLTEEQLNELVPAVEISRPEITVVF